MKARSRGLTLSEIVVSLGVLAIVALSVIGVFSKLLSSGGKQSNQAVARRLAEKVLARVSREGPPNNSRFYSFSGEEVLKTTRSDLATRFVYELNSETIKPVDKSVGRLLRLEVEVSWWPDSADANGGRQGQGRMSVKADQLVYLGQ